MADKSANKFRIFPFGRARSVLTEVLTDTFGQESSLAKPKIMT